MKHDVIKSGFLIWLLLCAVACKKVVIPEPEDSSPVFFTDLRLGDLDLNLTAGKSNYELKTRFKPDDDVMTFIGVFRPADCEADRCPKSLSIEIRDIQKFNRANFNVDQSLRTSNVYQYGWEQHRDSVEILFEVSHDADNSVQSLQPEWTFKPEPSNEEEGRGHVRAVFDRNVKYEVELITKVGQEKHRQIQTIDLANNSNCRTQLLLRGGHLWAKQLSAAKPVKYQWDGSDQTADHIMLDRTSIRKVYAVTVTDANDCECRAEIEGLRLTTNDRPSATADFSPKVEDHVKSLDRLKLGQVHIVYFNDNRKIYSTRKFSQPPLSSFRILSISDFQDNADGQRTKKMQVEVDCLLYGDDVNDTRSLSGKITMAVAYPN